MYGSTSADAEIAVLEFEEFSNGYEKGKITALLWPVIDLLLGIDPCNDTPNSVWQYGFILALKERGVCNGS